jgi:catechol 2,3-dioxygenase-like lactoylglutathione lyase family enzyme
MSATHGSLVAMGARVHLFVQPGEREAFTGLFRDVLGCEVVERDFGLPYPILLVMFPDGSFSVEFTELAPTAPRPGPIDDEAAFHGAWIEFRSTDLEGTLGALRSAGVPEFRHPGSPHAYFSAPGGQVFRILDVDYRGP